MHNRSLFQVDTVENFHGLERLIAIAVGLDEVFSPEATMESRARLYCALTRAQLFVVVVNEFLHGGCLEFLGHVELRQDGKMDTGEVDRKAAGALVGMKKKQMLEGKLADAPEKPTSPVPRSRGLPQLKNRLQLSSEDPESSQACVFESATAESSAAEESRAGGTDSTESQVKLLLDPAVREIGA